MPRREITFSIDDPADPLWTVGHVCGFLQISENQVRRRVMMGDFPKPLKLFGRALRWRRSTILAVVAEREAAACH